MSPIEEALEELKSQEHPHYTDTAKAFGVDRTTLSRRHRGLTASRGVSTDGPRLLTNQQEKTLTEYINKLTQRGFPPTPAMVRNFAKDIGGIQPAKNWLSRYVKRNREKLDSGYQLGFDLSRKKADNIYAYRLYFDKVSGPDWHCSHTYI